MVASIEAGSSKDFQTLIIRVDRLKQERAELLALRKKVSDVERATLSLASRFQKSRSKPRLLAQRRLIGSPRETRRPTVSNPTFETS
jgi:hypothetical protein